MGVVVMVVVVAMMWTVNVVVVRLGQARDTKGGVR